MSQCRKETEKNRQDRLGGDEQGNVRVSKHKISLGREGIQHCTQARVVQRNITSGGSVARYLGGSVKQQEGDSALGDGCAKSVLLCEGAESTSSVPKETEEDQTVGSAETETVRQP